MEWIKVEDGLPELKPLYSGGPKASARVVIFTRGYVTAGMLIETVKRTVKWVDSKGAHADVTHWMAFPEAPVTGEEIKAAAEGSGQ